MNKTVKSIYATLCGVVITTSGVFAQDAQNSSAATETCKEMCQPIFERESLILQHLTADISEKTGFTPSIVWTGEVWGDVSTSSVKSLADTLITFGVEQDLSIATGKKGMGSIGVSAFYYTQSEGGLANFDSSQGHFSNIVAGDCARVFEIYYANSFETKAGDIGFRIGQLAADEDFMGMDYSDVFLNSSLGAIPNVAPVNLFSQYNVATLGAVVYYSYESFDATVGIYNGNIGEDISSNNGFDYKHTFDTIALWYQLGYNYSLGELKGRAMFGGNYHSNPSKANFDQSEADSFYSFYVGVQQDILNDSEGNAILGAFARVGWAPDSKASDQNFYADFGLNWFAPIPSRKDDVFAIAFSVIENERAARADYDHYESVLEATYKFQISSAITIQPDLQIFFNNPNGNGDTQTTYIIGGRVEVVF